MFIIVKNGKIIGSANSLHDAQHGNPHQSGHDTGDTVVQNGERIALYHHYEDWKRKTLEELAAEGLDENGKKIPTKTETLEKEKKRVKIARLKTRIENLKTEIQKAENWEQEYLLPRVDYELCKLWDITKPLDKQMKEIEIHKKRILDELRELNSPYINKCKNFVVEEQKTIAKLEKEFREKCIQFYDEYEEHHDGGYTWPF